MGLYQIKAIQCDDEGYPLVISHSYGKSTIFGKSTINGDFPVRSLKFCFTGWFSSPPPGATKKIPSGVAAKLVENQCFRVNGKGESMGEDDASSNGERTYPLIVQPGDSQMSVFKRGHLFYSATGKKPSGVIKHGTYLAILRT